VFYVPSAPRDTGAGEGNLLMPVVIVFSTVVRRRHDRLNIPWRGSEVAAVGPL